MRDVQVLLGDEPVVWVQRVKAMYLAAQGPRRLESTTEFCGYDDLCLNLDATDTARHVD